MTWIRNEEFHAAKERAHLGFPKAVSAVATQILAGGVLKYRVTLDNGRTVEIKSHPRYFTPEFAALVANETPSG